MGTTIDGDPTDGESRTYSFREVLDTLIDAHVMLKAVRDESGTIVDFVYVEANQSACHYNGLARDQMVGKRLTEILPGQGGSILEAYRQVIETGEPLILDDYTYVQELPMMRGQTRQYDIRVSRVDDTLSYTWRDVTDQYRARQELSSSEQRFRLAMAVVPVGIAVLDLTWSFTEANPALCQLLQRDRRWLLSHPIEQVLLPGEMPRLTRAAADLLAGRAASVSLDQRFLTSAGDTVTLSHRIALAHDADGNPNSFVSQVVDGPQWTSGDATERRDNVLPTPRTLVACQADDHLLGTAVAALVERERVGQIIDVVPVHQLGERVEREQPDAVLVVLPAGAAAAGLFHEASGEMAGTPDTGVVWLCLDTQPAVRDRALRAPRPTTVLNMHGHTDVEVVDQALAAVVQGMTTVSQSENGWSLAESLDEEDPLSTLTEREREVLGLVAQGRDNATIAEELVVTTKAVENYISSIFRKLKLSDEEGTHRRVRAALLYLGAT